MAYTYITVLLTLNALWLFLVALGLPGTWLMVLSAAGLAWWRPEFELFSPLFLAALAGLALLAEIIEFISGSMGSKRAGGTRWGSVGALIGAIAGAILGTMFIPVPILGSIIGVCTGAFAGATAFELLGGRPVGESTRAGRGAALGRLVGIVVKLAIGGVIWVAIAIAAFT